MIILNIYFAFRQRNQYPAIMKFYVVVGILAALAMHALAEETKESSAATVVAAASTPSVTKTNVLGNYYDFILVFSSFK